MLPWDYHPDLTSERLVKVAQLLALGRGDAVDRFDPTIGDDNWTLGVCAYNYGCFQIARAAGTPGFEVAKIEKKMGLCASETASLVFQDCRVPKENLLRPNTDKAGESFKGAMKTFDMTRPMVAAMAVGIAQAALDEATRFADEHFTGPAAWRRSRVTRFRSARICFTFSV